LTRCTSNRFSAPLPKTALIVLRLTAYNVRTTVVLYGLDSTRGILIRSDEPSDFKRNFNSGP